MPTNKVNFSSLVRPLIALSFTLATIYLFVTSKISPQDILQTAGIIIGFYFGERSARKSLPTNVGSETVQNLNKGNQDV